MEKYKSVLSKVFTVTNSYLSDLDYSSVIFLLNNEGLTEECNFFVNNISKIKTDFIKTIESLNVLSTPQKVFLTILFYTFKKEEFNKEFENINNAILPLCFNKTEMDLVMKVFSLPDFNDMIKVDNLSFLREEFHLLNFFILNKEVGTVDVESLNKKIPETSVTAKEKIKYLSQYLIMEKYKISVTKEEAEAITLMCSNGLEITEIKRDYNESPLRMKFSDNNQVIKRSTTIEKLIKNDELILESKNVAKTSGVLRKML